MQQHDFTFNPSGKKNEQSTAHVGKATEAQSLGCRLLYARKSLNISAEDIADGMRLPVATIKAIEADDYTAFDNPVFLRGYIRAYAKYVHIPDEEIEALFIQLGFKDPAAAHKFSTFNVQQVSSRDKPVRLATYLIIIVFISLIVAWIYTHYSEEKSMTEANVVNVVATDAAQPAKVTQSANNQSTTNKFN